MFKNILIPTDGSVVSRKAIKAGIKLAQALGCLLYTSPSPRD